MFYELHIKAMKAFISVNIQKKKNLRCTDDVFQSYKYVPLPLAKLKPLQKELSLTNTPPSFNYTATVNLDNFSTAPYHSSPCQTIARNLGG